MSLTQSIGNNSEQLAADFLTEQGLVIIERNFRSKVGEIDLIARHELLLVFIEVRRRDNNNFGGAAASVNLAKRQKIRRTAQWFLQLKGLSRNSPQCRFDVIALCQGKIDWIRNAF